MYVGSNQITGAHHDGHDGKALFFRGSRIWAKTYSVSQTLDGVTSDAPNMVAWGDGLVVTLAATAGNKVKADSVAVTMGGVDITSTAYDSATNTITIASVTGNVGITAGHLPYEAEVEYLQSDGAAYIDLAKTLVSSTDVVDIDFMLLEGGSSARYIFGDRSSASSKNFTTLASSTDSIVIDINNGNYSTYRVNANQSAVGKLCSVHMERNDKSIEYDGVQMASSTTSSQSFTTVSNAYLFGAGSNSRAKIKLYVFQWRRGGDLLFDLIPVRKNGVGYLYDKVSGQLFGNTNSSGVFTYGNDK